MARSSRGMVRSTLLRIHGVMTVSAVVAVLDALCPIPGVAALYRFGGTVKILGRAGLVEAKKARMAFRGRTLAEPTQRPRQVMPLCLSTREASEQSALDYRALAENDRHREGHSVEHPQTQKSRRS